MTKELLLEIVNKKLIFELTIIIIIYLTAWLVTLKLGFQILGIKVCLKKMFPAIVILTLLSLCIKPLFSVSAFGMVMVILVIILLWVIGRANVIKTSWTALLVILFNALGDIIIITPLCSSDKNIATFFLKTIPGNILASIIDIIFPLLALIILPKLNLSLIPSFKTKITRFDIIGVLTYGAMYYVAYCASMRIYISLIEGPKHILGDLIYQWVATFTILLGHYTILTHTKKQREYERRIYEGQIIKLVEENRELIDINNHLKSQNLEPQEMVEVIDGIINKLQNVSNSINIQAKNNGHSESYELIDLSPREMNIIELIAQGKSNKEIAAAVYLSEGRIKNIITKLLEKLGLADRTQLAVYAVKNNLVSNE